MEKDSILKKRTIEQFILKERKIIENKINMKTNKETNNSER